MEPKLRGQKIGSGKQSGVAEADHRVRRKLDFGPQSGPRIATPCLVGD